MSSTNTSPATSEAFAVVRKGFDPDQVSAALERVEAEAELLRADRDAAVDRADRAAEEVARERARAASLEARVTELGRAPKTSEEVSDRVSTMLSVATAEAESIRDAAHAAADQIRADADEESWTLRESARHAAEADRGSAAAELTAARERAAAVRSEHSTVLDAARSRAAAIISAGERERERLDHEASTLRDTIDEDQRLAADARRSESLRDTEERHTASVAEADSTTRAAEETARRTVEDATAEAHSIMTRAHEHVAELRGIREEIVGELASLRARLELIPGRAGDHDAHIPVRPGVSSSDG